MGTVWTRQCHRLPHCSLAQREYHLDACWLHQQHRIRPFPTGWDWKATSCGCGYFKIQWHLCCGALGCDPGEASQRNQPFCVVVLNKKRTSGKSWDGACGWGLIGSLDAVMGWVTRSSSVRPYVLCGSSQKSLVMLRILQCIYNQLLLGTLAWCWISQTKADDQFLAILRQTFQIIETFGVSAIHVTTHKCTACPPHSHRQL